MVDKLETRILLQSIHNRRSLKQEALFPNAFPREWLDTMLEAANWAPSHGNTQPWRFVVYGGENRRALGEAFAQSYKLATPKEKYSSDAEEAQRSRVWKAPYWIALGMQPSGRHPEWEEIAAVAAAVQNIQLVAASMKVGSFWASGKPVTHEYTAQFVGFQPPVRLLGFLYLGQSAQSWPQGSRSDWREKVRWELG